MGPHDPSEGAVHPSDLAILNVTVYAGLPDLIIYPFIPPKSTSIELRLSTIRPPRPSRPDAPSLRSSNSFSQYLSTAHSDPSLFLSTKYIKRFDVERQNPSYAFPAVMEVPNPAKGKKRRKTDGETEVLPSSPTAAVTAGRSKGKRHATAGGTMGKRTLDFERSISLPSVPLNNDKESSLEAKNKLVMKKVVSSMLEERGMKRGTDTFNDLYLQIYRGVQLMAKLETPYALIPR
ncbi:hypothetical protein BT69DRAFT_1325111, partial [Atractiella rhizophila]